MLSHCCILLPLLSSSDSLLANAFCACRLFRFCIFFFIWTHDTRRCMRCDAVEYNLLALHAVTYFLVSTHSAFSNVWCGSGEEVAIERRGETEWHSKEIWQYHLLCATGWEGGYVGFALVVTVMLLFLVLFLFHRNIHIHFVTLFIFFRFTKWHKAETDLVLTFIHYSDFEWR